MRSVVVATCAGLVVACAVAASASCTSAPVPPGAYACLASAPACPTGQGCLLSDDGASGVCVVSSVCTVVDERDARVLRAAPGDARCDPGGEQQGACDDGVCVALACTDARREQRCGDTCLQTLRGEACDDGNTRDGDGCSGDCLHAEECGTGVVDVGEQCDDGNTNPLDGCDLCRTTRTTSALLVGGSVDGLRAQDVPLDLPLGVASDAAGRVYVSDSRNHRVWRYTPGIDDDAAPDVVVVAGTGSPGFSGDGGSALAATLCLPTGLAVDAFGRLFIADSVNHRIRRVDVDGVIDTVVGPPADVDDTACTFDFAAIDRAALGTASAPARDARLAFPLAVAVTPEGILYVLDTGNLIVRRVAPDGTIRTVVGTTDQAGGVPSTSFADPCGFPDPHDGSDPRAVRFGNGLCTGLLLGPTSMSLSNDGTLFIADAFDLAVRRVERGCLEGGAPCTVSSVSSFLQGAPAGVHVDDAGRLWFSDMLTRTVWVRDAVNGAVAQAPPRVALAANVPVHARAGSDALAAVPTLQAPFALTTTHNGDLYVVDPNARRLARVLAPDHTRIDEVMAPPADFCCAVGDEGPATEAPLFTPSALDLDAQGRLHVVETRHHLVRRIDTAPAGDGTIVTVAGTGVADLAATFGGSFGTSFGASPGGERPPAGSCGAPGSARTFAFASNEAGGPEGMALDHNGDIVVADTTAQALVRFRGDAVCTITNATSLPDNEPAPFVPVVVRRGFDDDLWVSDRTFLDGTIVTRIWNIDRNDTMQLWLTAQGSAQGLPASAVDLLPQDDAGRSLWVADSVAGVVWRATRDPVTRANTLQPVAGLLGDATTGVGADHAFATTIALASPTGLARCPDGSTVIAESGDGDGQVRLRSLDGSGFLHTLAGTGAVGGDGDFGPARDASFHLVPDALTGLVCAADGTVYVADRDNQRIRAIEPATDTIRTIAGRTSPRGPGPGRAAHWYGPTSLVVVPRRDGSGQVLGVGGAGRIVALDATTTNLDDARVRLVLGYDGAAFRAPDDVERSPLLQGGGGAVVDPTHRALLVAQRGAPTLRVIDLDVDDDGAIDDDVAWREALPRALVANRPIALAGLALDPRDNTLLAVDEAGHCVVAIDDDGALRARFGACGTAGDDLEHLRSPAGIVVAPSGVVYVADTGNHRVLRVDDAGATRVIGVGAPSSSGEGAPARQRAVRSPRQLALDEHGNLIIASTTAVRVVVNSDGDADADGDDEVRTIYGASRTRYPESDSFCIDALTLAPSSFDAPGAHGRTVLVADSCLGTVSAVFVVDEDAP